MAGRYGMTQAAKLISEGRYEEAIEEATKRHQRDGEDPDPLIERAEANALLDRFDQAFADLEQAIAVGSEVLDVDTVDDAYFSALLGAAKKAAESSVDKGVKLLSRYGTIIPKGRHVKDAADWAKRLKGELASQFVKEGT